MPVRLHLLIAKWSLELTRKQSDFSSNMLISTIPSATIKAEQLWNVQQMQRYRVLSKVG